MTLSRTALRPQLALCLSLLLPAPAAFASNLMEVYGLAHDSDPQFRQVAASKRAVLEQRPQAMSQLLPQVNLNANYRQYWQDLTTQSFGASGAIDFESHGYALNLSQPIFHRDRFILLDEADSRIKQADAQLGAAQQDLMIRVSESYFNVLAALDTLQFAQAEKKSLSRQLEQAKQRFDVGLTAITDVQEAQAGYDRAVAEEIAAENAVDNARESLREITGEYLTALAPLGSGMPLVEPDPDNIEQWTSTSLEQNLNVIAAMHGVDVARSEIKVQNAGHLPTLDLVANHGYDSSGGRFGVSKSHSTSVGVELNVPIYSGGFVSSRVRESQQRLDEQLEALEQARRQAHRLTRQAYLGVISGISQVKALQQAVVSSDTALQATQAGFEVGTRTAVDVVTAERGAYQARRDYAAAKYQYILNTLRLKQAAGTLSDEDLAAVNRWLE